MRRRSFLAAIPAAVAATIFPPASGARAGVRAGAELRGPVIDCHIHPMSQALYDLISPFANKQGSALRHFTGAAIVDYLNNIGAQKAYALSSGYLWGGVRPQETISEFTVRPGEYEKVRAENDFTAEQAAKYPDRIIPFLGINPLKPYALEELDRCVGTLKMRGLKMHFWNSGVNLRENSHLDRIQPVFEYAASHRLAVMLHFYNGRVEDFGPRDGQLFADNVLAEYPDLPICFAHFLGAGNYADVVGNTVDTIIRTCDDRPELNRDRLFMDLSAIFNRQARGRFAGVTQRQLIRLGAQISKWGLPNILWGSDNREGYLATTRAMWPLGSDEFGQVMSNDGSLFLDS